MPKVKIDKELLLKVAKNSRVNLSDSEVKKFLPQMQEILEAFSKLDELKAEAVKPSFQPTRIKNVFREDKAGKCFTQEQALSLTKHKKGDYFKGPKVMPE